MKKMICVLVAALLVSLPAAAHHSWASGYFVDDPYIEIEGVVSSLTWANPHIRVGVIVDQGLPTEQEWLLESSSVAMLTRMHVEKEMMSIGTTIKAAGWAARQSDTGLYMNNALLPNGDELIFLRDAEPHWVAEADKVFGDTDALSGRVYEEDINKRPESIFAVWNTIYGDPGSHAMAARAAADAAAAAEAGRANRPPPPPRIDPNYSIETYECTPKAMPQAMGNPYPIEFSQVGENIQLRLEEYDMVRTFHMTDMHDDSAAELSLTGYSTGVWEGDKLVVTTTKVSNSPNARYTETFQMRADREYVDYTRSAVGGGSSDSKYWRYVPGTEMQPYDCTSELNS
jgi:hypothetical protein